MKTLIVKPWIDKILDVSTVHITENDSRLLGVDSVDSDERDDLCYPDGNRLLVIQNTYGFFVCVYDAKDEQFRDDFSKEFKAIMAEARRLKCKWVCFDQDGSEYEGLKKFEW